MAVLRVERGEGRRTCGSPQRKATSKASVGKPRVSKEGNIPVATQEIMNYSRFRLPILLIAMFGVILIGATLKMSNKKIDADNLQEVYITSYGYNDNNNGAGHYGTGAIAYPNIIHKKATESTGTYNDPITFATDPEEVSPGTIVYVPYLRKYFIMEDQCAECMNDWRNKHTWHIDLFMGGNDKIQPEPTLSNCEAYITRKALVDLKPKKDYLVDTNPLFKNGICSAHIFEA